MAAQIIIKPLAGGFPGLGKRAQNATARVLNRVGASVRATAVRDIASDLRTTQAIVRAAIVLRRATFSRLQADVVARGRRIAIMAMGARQTRGGVTYAGAGGRRLIPGAFIPRFRSGHAGVFKRVGRRRLPIRELFGPSIPLIFIKEKLHVAMRRVIRERMPVETAAALRFYGGGD